MGLRFPAITRFMALAAVCASAPIQALEFPLRPPGGAEVNDLGFNEIVAANPGVDAWLPGAGADVVLPTRYILPPGPREGIVINIAEYRLYYFPKGKNVVYTYP